MLQLKPRVTSVVADPFEPGRHSLKEWRRRGVLSESLLGQGRAARLRALMQKLHVDKNLIHIVSLLSPTDLRPELLLGSSQEVRNEAVLLDVPRGKGAVEVVDNWCSCRLGDQIHDSSPLFHQ